MIDDESFKNGLSYLASQGVLDIPSSGKFYEQDKKIPSWFHSTSTRWANDVVYDEYFMKGLIVLTDSS